MNKLNDLVNEISSYILKEVRTTTDLQSTVFYEDIQEEFRSKMQFAFYDAVEELLNNKEEVVEVYQGNDGFEVVLFTDFYPN